jgi:hypothetical protein
MRVTMHGGLEVADAIMHAVPALIWSNPDTDTTVNRDHPQCRPGVFCDFDLVKEIFGNFDTHSLGSLGKRATSFATDHCSKPIVGAMHGRRRG